MAEGRRAAEAGLRQGQRLGLGAEVAAENHDGLPEHYERASVRSCGPCGQALGLGNISENPRGRAERVALPQARSSRGISLCFAASGSKEVRLAAGAVTPALHPPGVWGTSAEVAQKCPMWAGSPAQSSTTTSASTCSHPELTRVFRKIHLLSQAMLDRYAPSPKARWEVFSSGFLEIYNKPQWDMMVGKRDCGTQLEI